MGDKALLVFFDVLCKSGGPWAVGAVDLSVYGQVGKARGEDPINGLLHVSQSTLYNIIFIRNIWSPLSQPVVITISANALRLSVPTFPNQLCSETRWLAEWIIDNYFLKKL